MGCCHKNKVSLWDWDWVGGRYWEDFDEPVREAKLPPRRDRYRNGNALKEVFGKAS